MSVLAPNCALITGHGGENGHATTAMPSSSAFPVRHPSMTLRSEPPTVLRSRPHRQVRRHGTELHEGPLLLSSRPRMLTPQVRTPIPAMPHTVHMPLEYKAYTLPPCTSSASVRPSTSLARLGPSESHGADKLAACTGIRGADGRTARACLSLSRARKCIECVPRWSCDRAAHAAVRTARGPCVSFSNEKCRVRPPQSGLVEWLKLRVRVPVAATAAGTPAGSRRYCLRYARLDRVAGGFADCVVGQMTGLRDRGVGPRGKEWPSPEHRFV